jgi:putative transposase
MQVFTLTFEFKLKPTSAQIAVFEDWLEQCRRVYNYALTERKDWFKSRSCQVNACSLHSEYIIPADARRPTYASQCKRLTEARAKIPALGAVQVHVLQQTLKRLEQAFVSMWEQGHGFPTLVPQLSFAIALRKQVLCVLSCFHRWALTLFTTVLSSYLKLVGSSSVNRVKFPKGQVLKQVRIVRRASGWYAMLALQWDVEVPDVMPHGEAIGVDVGISHLAAVSNGKLFPNPRPFRKLERKRKHCCNKEYRERLRGQTIARKHKSKSVNYTSELQIPGKTTIGYWHIISVIGQQ